MDKIIERISKRFEEAQAKRPFFPDKQYKAIDISQDNFHQIPRLEAIPQTTYIDGGNIEILGNGTFSVQLMRTCSITYKENKRSSVQKKEYVVSIMPQPSEKPAYVAEIYEGDDLLETITIPLDREEQSTPETVIGIMRRIYEIRSVIDIRSGIAVLDGSLCARHKLEHDALTKAHEHCAANQVALCAISKTSSYLTDTGHSLIGYIHSLAPETSWYYHPVCINTNPLHRADILIARLHARSEYAFVLDITPGSEKETILSALALNARDPVFLGYPYGLVDADVRARCTEEERSILQARFLMKGKHSKIRRFMNAGNAHDILDSIR